MQIFKEDPEENNYPTLGELGEHLFGKPLFIAGVTEVNGITFLTLRRLQEGINDFQCRLGEMWHDEFKPHTLPDNVREAVEEDGAAAVVLWRHEKRVAVHFVAPELTPWPAAA